MEDRDTARMRKYGESKTTRIMMATVPHVISGLELRKFQADGFLLTRVYIISDFRYLYSRQVSLVQSKVPSLFLNKSASRHLNFSLQAFKRMSTPETGIMLQVNRLNSISDLLPCN